jgi:putative hydrolase of the HAD superfamily
MSDTTPTVLLFDLDDTICQYRRSHDEVLAAAFDRCGVEPFFSVADFDRWVPRVEATSPLDLREQCFAAICREQGRNPALGERVAAAYRDRDPRNIEFLPGARAALETLGEQYTLGLVTNGGEATQRPKLDALGIVDAFETIVFATPDAAIKPDPAPFHAVLSALGAEPSMAIHIGDSLASDVAGAQAAGIDAVWLRSGTDISGNKCEREHSGPVPEFVIDSVAELRAPPFPWEP